MKIIVTNNPSAPQKAAIYYLWNNEYPRQLAFHHYDELEGYLTTLSDQHHYFVADNAGRICGWAVVFERENERWFAIIIDGAWHRKGVGAKLLAALKETETELNGWVTDHDRYTRQDGTAYPSPLTFYCKNGFVVCAETRLETEKLNAVKIRWNRQ